MITDEFADGKPRENVLARIMATQAREVAEAKAFDVRTFDKK